MNKTSVYIHTPYCKSKCRYCDFPSFSGMEDTVSEYFSALSKEISRSVHRGKKIDTVFFGGGTPSYVNEKYIAGVMDTLRENFTLSENCEITIETNPGTLTKDKLSTYKDCCINRISMGMQCHDDRILSVLGRIHTSEDIINGVELINSVGITNYNLDIMCALPTQKLRDLEKSLEFAVKLNPTHISAYSLIIEEGTPFYDTWQELDLPDEEEERKMYHLCKDYLASYGYERYEVSNYAKEGYICRHNKYCWDYEDYIGFGSAAHSFCRPVRWENVADVHGYISAIKNNTSPVRTFEELTREDMIEEYIMLALRKTEGIEISRLREEFGYDILSHKSIELSALIKSGYVGINDNNLFITEKGFDIADSITLKLL